MSKLIDPFFVKSFLLNPRSSRLERFDIKNIGSDPDRKLSVTFTFFS